MKAVILSEFGGPEVLKVADLPDPKPVRGEALVRVVATALNRADILQRKGQYNAPKGVRQDVPGLEFAGVVDDIAEDVEGINVGDRVFGLVAGGSYAQYVVTHHRTLAKIPDNLSITEAAAVPEAFVTAYDAMISQARLQSGEFVLIHAAGSGVGTAAVQLAKAIGAQSIGTSRTQDKLDKTRALGLDHGLLLDSQAFADRVLELTGDSGGVNVVLELIGGNYLAEDLKCLSLKGRIILIGLLAGAKTEVNLAHVLSKRAQIVGTTLRARPLEEKILAGRLLAENIVPLLKAGIVKPIVDRVFDMEEASEAHRYMENNDSFGKVVLSI